jgi:hypothetical protein
MNPSPNRTKKSTESATGSQENNRSNFQLNASASSIVKEQLRRLLASPLFNRSVRYPTFLTYVVNAMLENPSLRLKEQTVGIEVFGRAPGYDTNQDHIVRSTAVEIRRRLKQYYSDLEHRNELVITLPAGWYTPQFLAPESFIAPTGGSLRSDRVLPDSIAKLWSPLIEESDSVLVCISPLVFQERAEPDSEPETVAEMHLRDRNRVALVDAVSMSRFVSFLSAYGVAAQIWSSHELTIDQFSRAPVVLIGALNNKWTVRFTASLRFRFCVDEKSATVCVYDQETPGAPVGSLNWSRPVAELEQDFAIVTRLMDQAIGKPILAVGGITILGTSAAAEFITNPQRVAEIERNAPAGWQSMNFQLLLSVRIIEGHAAPAQIHASAFW